MKTYCISDIHGHYDNLMDFVDTLEDDDKVYVLGDVIDKGEDSIKCLLYIMEDKRFEMLLGNHEYMMFQYLADRKGFKSYPNMHEAWVEWNEGFDTLYDYNVLPSKKREQIYEYIKNLPLNIPNVKVNGRTFYLVHSCPKDDNELKMEDVDYYEDYIYTYVWQRCSPADNFNMEDKIIVAGHTFIQYFFGNPYAEVKAIFDYEGKLETDPKLISKAHYIDIDGGLATRSKTARLIALCLDDLTYELY